MENSVENLVYMKVKKARLAIPVKTKELEDVKATYGVDLYKKALSRVLTERMKAKSEE